MAFVFDKQTKQKSTEIQNLITCVGVRQLALKRRAGLAHVRPARTKMSKRMSQRKRQEVCYRYRLAAKTMSLLIDMIPAAERD